MENHLSTSGPEACRSWGCRGCHAPPPDFGRSVNPISTRRGRLCPPHWYWHPRIFRPSYGPAFNMLEFAESSRGHLLLWVMRRCSEKYFLFLIRISTKWLQPYFFYFDLILFFFTIHIKMSYMLECSTYIGVIQQLRGQEVGVGVNLGSRTWMENVNFCPLEGGGGSKLDQI